MIKKKRGLSPVIATVLLIAMVVVMGLIVFLWFKNMVGESITKFGDQNIELACGDVDFDADYSNGVLYVLNTGNVPIFDMKIKVVKEGSYSTEELEGDWPAVGLNAGGTFSGSIGNDVAGSSEITLVPVLLGSSDRGKRTFVCDERYGYGIQIV